MSYINKDILIKKFDENRWVINTPQGKNVLVNQRTAELLETLQKSASEKEALEAVNTKFKLSSLELERLLSDKFQNLNILEREGNVKIEKYSYLNLKLDLLNTEVAGVLAQPFKFLYKEKLFWLLLTCVFCLLSYLLYYNLTISEIDIHRVKAIEIIGLFYFSMLIHELGHIAACRQFNIAHGAIGFGFYIVFPVVYADISNIWTATRQQRIIANLGGIFLELVYALTIACVGIFLNNISLLIVSGALYIKTLTELNPFIRYDGYWILSDLSHTPNLLPRSNYLLRTFVKSKILRKSNGPLPSFNLKSYSLLSYGLVNAGFIVFYIIIILNNYFKEILRFPVNIYKMLQKLLTQQLHWGDLKMEYILVLGFYIILIRLVIQIGIKVRKRYSAVPN